MKFLILLALIGFAAASTCDNRQRGIVKQQWTACWNSAQAKRTDIGRTLFQKVFDGAPQARALFNRVNVNKPYSGEFAAHVVRVLGGVDSGVALLDEPATLKAQTAHLKKQHAVRRIPARYFPAFRNALIDVVSSVNNGVNKGAWLACFDEFSPQ